MYILKKFNGIKIAIIFFLFLQLFAAPALAHDASVTYTSISIVEDHINVALTTPFTNILAYYDKELQIEDIDLTTFFPYFAKGFHIDNNGKPCTPKIDNVQPIPEDKLVAYQFVFRCPGKIELLTFRYDLFFNASEKHENITDFYIDNYSAQHIFSKEHATFTLPVSDVASKLHTYNALWNSFHFFTLGIQHILIGYDHILFLLGLLLITTKFRQLFKLISSFTIAHSITLILATLHVTNMPSKITESLIALSIVYIAGENIVFMKENGQRKNYPRFFSFFAHPSKRWIITFLFGLIHGFGFSSVLSELGLPEEGLVASLLMFNVGIEIGQLCIVVLIFPLLFLLRKSHYHRKTILGLSTCIGLLGIFWFIQRILG